MKLSTPQIIEQIQRYSQLPIQNIVYLQSYLEQSKMNNTPITFFDWECPPRFIDKTVFGQKFVNYNVDIEKIFQKKKIDSYTELPRTITARQREQSFLRLLNEIGVKYRFIKIVADTNAYFITPESVSIIGNKKLNNAFRQFQKSLIVATGLYPKKVTVILFSKLLKSLYLENEYKKVFRQALSMLKEPDQKLVSRAIIKAQYQRTNDHVGIAGRKSIREFSFRTIATYAAEGVIFNCLSNINSFSNCVWLNMSEADSRVIAITNCMRNKRKISPLPMIFPL